MQHDSHSPIRPLGAQSLPIRWRDARALADRLGGVGSQRIPEDYASPGSKTAFAGAAPGRGVSAYARRDTLPIRLTYEAVSLALTGKLERANRMADSARALGSDIIPTQLVEAVSAAFEPLRARLRQLAAGDPMGFAPEAIFGNTRFPLGQFVSAPSNAREAAARAARGEFARQMLNELNPANLREQLFLLGVRDGLRGQDGNAIQAILHGTDGAHQAFTAAAGPYARLAQGQRGGIVLEHGQTYAESLFDRGGVPLTKFGMEALQEGHRDIWRNDPSFLDDPVRQNQMLDLPEVEVAATELARVEAEVDAKLRARG